MWVVRVGVAAAKNAAWTGIRSQVFEPLVRGLWIVQDL